jgi:S-adenosylmethionine decarboxylase proenzyme
MKYLGSVFTLDLFDCDIDLLKNVPSVEAIMLTAAHAGRATIVSHTFKQFDPWGVSGVIIISESHMAIHTWPEYGYAAVDIFTCGTEMDPSAACSALIANFDAKTYKLVKSKRGSVKKLTKKNPE